MNLVLPILIGAVVVGITAKKMNPGTWFLMGVWISLVVAYHYLKHG